MCKNVNKIAQKCQEIVDFDVGIIRNRCVLIDFDGVSPNMDRFWPSFVEKSSIFDYFSSPNDPCVTWVQRGGENKTAKSGMRGFSSHGTPKE